VFVPISDENPLRSIRVAYVTILLIAANCVVFLLQVSTINEQMAISLALVPDRLLKFVAVGGPAFAPSDEFGVPQPYTLLSYMFLHGNIVHLAGNMLFLWVFADNIEDAFGHFKFLIFYIVCGLFAGLTHVVMLPTSSVPLIGASGAVAGVIAAYVVLHPQVRVWVLAFRFIPLRITAALALGAWIVVQLAMVALPYLVASPQLGPVAWWAHVGGLLAGGVLVVFLRRPGVPLFGRTIGVGQDKLST
jgi:membrane associated rhomboid family serine protease